MQEYRCQLRLQASDVWSWLYRWFCRIGALATGPASFTRTEHILSCRHFSSPDDPLLLRNDFREFIVMWFAACVYIVAFSYSKTRRNSLISVHFKTATLRQFGNRCSVWWRTLVHFLAESSGKEGVGSKAQHRWSLISQGHFNPIECPTFMTSPIFDYLPKFQLLMLSAWSLRLWHGRGRPIIQSVASTVVNHHFCFLYSAALCRTLK